MAARLDLEDLWHGDTGQYTFEFKQGDGSAHNLEGSTAVFRLKESLAQADTDAVITKSIALPNGDADAQAGRVAVTIPVSETSALQPIHYEYELQIVTPDTPEDIVTTYLVGAVRVRNYKTGAC